MRVEVIKENPQFPIGFKFRVLAQDDKYYVGAIIRIIEDGTFQHFYEKIEKEFTVPTTKTNMDRFVEKN